MWLKVAPYLILIAALIASHGVAYYKGRAGGKSDIYREWHSAQNAATEKKLDVKEKQDEIRNAPVDVGVTARRLRNGNF